LPFDINSNALSKFIFEFSCEEQSKNTITKKLANKSLLIKCPHFNYCAQRPACSRSAGVTCCFFSFPRQLAGQVQACLPDSPALSADGFVGGMC
jgi:hypothetical protein